MLNGTLKQIQRLLQERISLEIHVPHGKPRIVIELMDDMSSHSQLEIRDPEMIRTVLESMMDELAPHIEACYQNLKKYQLEAVNRQRRDG